MKAKRIKRKSTIQRLTTTTLILSILFVTTAYIHYTYKNIDINSTNYKTEKVQSTAFEQTVENEEEKSKN